MQITIQPPVPTEPDVVITLTMDEARKLRAITGEATLELARTLFAGMDHHRREMFGDSAEVDIFIAALYDYLCDAGVEYK